MVKLPRHATEQPTAWPQWKCFFFLFSFFFIFFAFSLEALSLQLVPLFPTSICLQHPRTSNSSSCYSYNMDMPAWSFLFHVKFYDKLTILSEKQKVAHNQLNAEGLVSSGAQKAIREVGHRKGREKSPPPLSGGRGKKKKNNSSQKQQDLFPHFSTPSCYHLAEDCCQTVQCGIGYGGQRVLVTMRLLGF